MKFNHKKGKKNHPRLHKISALPFSMALVPLSRIAAGAQWEAVKPYALEEVGTVNTSLNLLSEQPWQGVTLTSSPLTLL